MTHINKLSYEVLLKGGYIVCAGSSGYRVLDVTGFPVVRITAKSFANTKSLLRRGKIHGTYLINKTEVRKLHGLSFIKKLYNQLKN